MKNKLLLLTSSIGISVLYLIVKVLIIQESITLISIGCWISIIAGLWAGSRFILYRKAYELAIVEFGNVLTAMFKIYNPHIGNTNNEQIFKIFVIIGAIIILSYFTYLYVKTNDTLKRLKYSAFMAYLISGAGMLTGFNVIFLAFSGLGYYITGKYEDKNDQPDKIYSSFCYIATGISIIMIFI